MAKKIPTPVVVRTIWFVASSNAEAFPTNPATSWAIPFCARRVVCTARLFISEFEVRNAKIITPPMKVAIPRKNNAITITNMSDRGFRIATFASCGISEKIRMTLFRLRTPAKTFWEIGLIA